MRTINTPEFAHVLEASEEWAIKAALAANRPLLVRGEPGVGKTQLARAAAFDLKRPLVSMTVDANTEARELMWSFDAVQRLAEAQVAAVTCKDDVSQLESRIAVKRFVKPGPIWWAFDWNSALEQLGDDTDEEPQKPKGWKPKNGVVILIDEIDKAESEVPNGLLEAFGSRQFKPQGRTTHLRMNERVAPPLVVITTNEERVLPDAFVRRCFVLRKELPAISHTNPSGDEISGQDQEFIDFLIKRGQAHYPDVSESRLIKTARLLLNDRRTALQRHQSPLPGQAEYLDFLRALVTLTKNGDNEADIFEQVQQFVFQKSHEPGE